MDWKRTKTIFILTFLVLNLFLGYQLYMKVNKNKLQNLVEQPLEKKLADKHISYKGTIPAYDQKETLISGQRYTFTTDEVKELKAKDILVDDTDEGNTLVFELKKPLGLAKSNEKKIDELESFIKDHSSRGDEYEFFKFDKEDNVVWFSQMYQDKQIFVDTNPMVGTNAVAEKNTAEQPSGTIKCELDEKGNLIRFTQTYISVMRQGAPQEIISPKKALGRLLNTNHLVKGDSIQHIVLGYYSLANVEDVQVYAPTWSIETEDAHYLVNAIDSSVQKLEGKQ
ncbi:two-component system regulatory protein YycI [Fictibacillus sp. Mic-4]|uniref:two-component system regulatory protein YycI n=1 Tax=Fictibacillus TaxID=1329200 RepID=UPI0004059356|nr:two-component system regulatory protein YycI [Fictibacillus gelatini]